MVQPLTFFIYHFCQKRYPFCSPSIGDPFTWLVKNFTFPSTTVNDCIINMNKSQNQKVFSTTSQPSKSSFSPFGPFYRPKWLISLPFQIPETWKWYPLRAEPPRLSIIGTTPPPPPRPHPLGWDFGETGILYVWLGYFRFLWWGLGRLNKSILMLLYFSGNWNRWNSPKIRSSTFFWRK